MRVLWLIIYLLPLISCGSQSSEPTVVMDGGADASRLVDYGDSGGVGVFDRCRKIEVVDVDIDGVRVRFEVSLPCRDVNLSRDFGDPVP